MPGRDIAILVGIENYTDGIPQLSTPRADVCAVARRLHKGFCFDVTVVNEQDATKDGLTDLLGGLAVQHRLEPDDRVIFYYAGHGHLSEQENGTMEGYLVPFGGPSRRQRDNFLAMADVRRALAALPCRHVLTILDCCAAGAFSRSTFRDLEMPPPLFHERYDRYLRLGARQVITSCAYDERALDAVDGVSIGDRGERGGVHSPFCALLLRALSTGVSGGWFGRPRGLGMVTAAEIYVYIKNQLHRLLMPTNHRQTVGFWTENGHEGGDFVMARDRDRREELTRAEALLERLNPWRGLNPYTSDDNDVEIFTGRDDVLDRLEAHVRSQMVTVLVGASGVGKSSLIRAGLHPRIKNDSGIVSLDPIRPESAPMAALRHLDGLPPGQRLDERVIEWFIVRGATPGELLLVIDQAEELITLCTNDDERREFLLQIQEAVERASGRVRIVWALRSDFEPSFRALLRRSLEGHSPGVALADDEAWSAARFHLPAMSRRELRQVIERPAEIRVLFFEDEDLVEELLHEVDGMPGALPLLSFTLSEMYLRLCVKLEAFDRTLDRQTYRALGRVAGALRSRADKLYDDLPTKEKDTLLRIMQRMVSLEAGQVARRRIVREEELDWKSTEGARVQTVCGKLLTARLLVSDKSPDGKAVLEPAHDALIPAWDRLWNAVSQSKANLLLLRPLGQAARAWQSGVGGLWDRDPRLAQAAAILEKDPLWFNRPETAFIQASLRRQRTQLVTIVATTAVVFAALGFAALYSNYQRKQADTRARAARSGQLAAEAQSIATVYPIRGALLAVHALAATREASEPPTPSAMQVLYDTSAAVRGFGLAGHVAGVTAVTIGTEMGLLATGGGLDDGFIRVWALDGSEGPEHWLLLKGALKSETNEGIESLTFAASGQRLVSLTTGGNARIWDLTASDPSASSTLVPHTTAVAVSADGAQLAAGRNDGSVALLDLTNPEAAPRILGPGCGRVRSLAFNASGLLLAAGGGGGNEDGAICLYDLESAEESPSWRWVGGHHQVGGMYARQAADVSMVSFSPDGRWLLSVSRSWFGSSAFADPDARLWDLSVPTAAPHLLHHGALVSSAAWSNDGRLLATGSSDSVVRVWDLDVADPSATPDELRGHRGMVTQVTFDIENRLISTSDDKTVRLWPVAGSPSERDALVLLGHEDAIDVMALSNDGAWLVTGGKDRTARLWSFRGVPYESYPIELGINASCGDSILVPEISSDFRWMIVQGCESSQLWELSALESWGTQGPMRRPIRMVRTLPGAARISPDGRSIIANDKERVSLYRLDPDPAASPIALAGLVDPMGPWVSADGRRLLTRTNIGTVKVWDLHAVDPGARSVDIHGDWRGLWGDNPFSGNGRWVVTVSPDDSTIELWDLNAGGAALVPVPLAHVREANITISFSPDNRWIAVVPRESHEVLLVGLEGHEPGRRRYALRGHSTDVHQLTFSPDGGWLVTSSFTRERSAGATARLWDLTQLDADAQGYPLEAHHDRMTEVLFRADSRWLATASNDDDAVHLWPLDHIRRRPEDHILRGHQRHRGVHAWSIAFDSSSHLVTGHMNDPTVLLWDLNSRNPAASAVALGGHEHGVAAVSFSSDDRWLATLGSDGMRLWDTGAEHPETTSILLRMSGAGSPSGTVAWSPDGRWVVGWLASDAVLRVWPLQAEMLVSNLRHIAGRNLSAFEWALYFPGQDYRETFPGLYVEPQVAHNLISWARFRTKDEAARLWAQVVAMAVSGSDPGLCNHVCWQGSLEGVAGRVLPACERAVELAPADGNLRDSRALARALTGDRAGAIADFESYVAWARTSGSAKESIARRVEWVRALSEGRDPFDRDTLEKLRSE